MGGGGNEAVKNTNTNEIQILFEGYHKPAKLGKSILRSTFLEIIQSKLNEFPVLVRKILKNSHSHKGEVEILVLNRAAETQLRPRPKDFGKYKWVKIYTCTSDCHNSSSKLKSFDFFFFLKQREHGKIDKIPKSVR